jgi:hypothetical protein
LFEVQVVQRARSRLPASGERWNRARGEDEATTTELAEDHGAIIHAPAIATSPRPLEAGPETLGNIAAWGTVSMSQTMTLDFMTITYGRSRIKELPVDRALLNGLEKWSQSFLDS